MPDHSFSEEMIPNIQSTPPLMQLEAISSHPIASSLGEETNTCLTTTSLQVIVQSDKVPPQPPLLQTAPAPSAAPLKTCSPDPSPASLLFSGHAPATHCPSCSEGPKTDHSTRGLNTGHVSSVAARATLTARGRNKEANSASQGMWHCHHFTCHLRTTVPRPSPEDRWIRVAQWVSTSFYPEASGLQWKEPDHTDWLGRGEAPRGWVEPIRCLESPGWDYAALGDCWVCVMFSLNQLTRTAKATSAACSQGQSVFPHTRVKPSRL